MIAPVHIVGKLPPIVAIFCFVTSWVVFIHYKTLLLWLYYRAHQKYNVSDPGVSFSNPVFAASSDNKYPVEQKQPPSPSPPPQQQQHYFELDEYEDTI